MEVQTVSFGYVGTPLKEGCPRHIGNALAEVFVLNHIGGFQILRNKNVIFITMVKFVDEFSDKLFAFVYRPLMV